MKTVDNEMLMQLQQLGLQQRVADIYDSPSCPKFRCNFKNSKSIIDAKFCECTQILSNKIEPWGKVLRI
ncbi:MAG: hypothetical protein GY928_26240 [Colwellia sp.]|nr:hypothetical protein [Colwellia sp.]